MKNTMTVEKMIIIVFTLHMYIPAPSDEENFSWNIYNIGFLSLNCTRTLMIHILVLLYPQNLAQSEFFHPDKFATYFPFTPKISFYTTRTNFCMWTWSVRILWTAFLSQHVSSAASLQLIDNLSPSHLTPLPNFDYCWQDWPSRMRYIFNNCSAPLKA